MVFQRNACQELCVRIAGLGRFTSLKYYQNATHINFLSLCSGGHNCSCAQHLCERTLPKSSLKHHPVTQDGSSISRGSRTPLQLHPADGCVDRSELLSKVEIKGSSNDTGGGGGGTTLTNVVWATPCVIFTPPGNLERSSPAIFSVTFL